MKRLIAAGVATMILAFGFGTLPAYAAINNHRTNYTEFTCLGTVWRFVPYHYDDTSNGYSALYAYRIQRMSGSGKIAQRHVINSYYSAWDSHNYGQAGAVTDTGEISYSHPGYWPYLDAFARVYSYNSSGVLTQCPTDGHLFE